MVVFLNGEMVREEAAVVSVFDRAFLYGDGLYETLRVLHGQPFRWEQHLERLESGARFLQIALPFSRRQLRQAASELISGNQVPDALLRMTLSRGVGIRGYSPKGAERPVMVMSVHPGPRLELQAPTRWRLITASIRLPADDPLARFKTCNKLPQVLARAQADAADAEEALLLNTNGHAAEAASSNLFWLRGGTVCTPPLASGVLPGVTRAAVFELCPQLKLAVAEQNITPGELLAMEGVFLALSSFGVVEAISLDDKALGQSALVSRIKRAYDGLLERETRAGV